MNPRRIAATLIFLGIMAGTFALSQPSDIEVLTRIGKTTVHEIRGGMPESSKFSGPLAAFRAGDALPIEENVRVRIHTDKDMAGAEVIVAATPSPGQVKLKGIVQSSSQKSRAIDLAERTAGVQTVIDELAIPTSP